MEHIPFPQVEDKLPHYLQKEEFIRLRNLVKEHIDYRAIIELFYATGIRLMELVELKKESINWGERIITIPNGKRKKERIVLFTRECGEHLKAYLEYNQDDKQPFVFANYHPRSIQLRFNEYSTELGVSFTPHTLRHTFAAHLAIKGMPLECIQVLLGHNGPHQTQLYARLYHEARKEIYDQFM